MYRIKRLTKQIGHRSIFKGLENLLKTENECISHTKIWYQECLDNDICFVYLNGEVTMVSNEIKSTSVCKVNNVFRQLLFNLDVTFERYTPNFLFFSI